MDTKIHRFLDNRDFDSKNLLIHLLDDEYNESDEEVPNLITHSYYCCSKDFLNKINCVDGTTILTLNCQSLSAKYDSICILLRSMQYKIDVICLHETWCETQSQYEKFPLDHYNYVATCCTATKHGGLITYLKKDYDYKYKHYGNHSNIWESQFIEISNQTSKKSTVIGPHRILILIYTSLIESHINYCILLWGTNYDKIFKLQKQAIRTISLNHFKAHTSPLFKSMNFFRYKGYIPITAIKIVL